MSIGTLLVLPGLFYLLIAIAALIGFFPNSHTDGMLAVLILELSAMAMIFGLPFLIGGYILYKKNATEEISSGKGKASLVFKIFLGAIIAFLAFNLIGMIGACLSPGRCPLTDLSWLFG